MPLTENQQAQKYLMRDIDWTNLCDSGKWYNADSFERGLAHFADARVAKRVSRQADGGEVLLDHTLKSITRVFQDFSKLCRQHGQSKGAAASDKFRYGSTRVPKRVIEVFDYDYGTAVSRIAPGLVSFSG